MFSDDLRCSVMSEPTPRKPRKMPFSSRRGDADNSHHRFCPPISTSSGKLLKLSRRLIFSARTRSVSENRPDSHELPASIWSSVFDRKSGLLGKSVSVRLDLGGS